MKPLTRPGWDTITDFDAIVSVKRTAVAKAALNDARPAVYSSASRFRTCAPHLETFAGEPVSDTQKNALLACFQPRLRTTPCKEMLVRLRKLNPSPKCPLCGVDSAPTFDHYLPTSLFPELAVCAHNLVPSCYRCNNARNNRWMGEYGRTTLHLYYDWIPETSQILTADVWVENCGPVAHYRVEAKPDTPGFPGRYARHCDALGLLELFDESAPNGLEDLVSVLRSFDTSDHRWAQNGLQRHAEDRARRYGVNHWETALCEGAARSDDFIRYALEGGET